jgi:hypothetical protein
VRYKNHLPNELLPFPSNDQYDFKASIGSLQSAGRAKFMSPLTPILLQASHVGPSEQKGGGEKFKSPQRHFDSKPSMDPSPEKGGGPTRSFSKLLALR